ncbi:hypothetical protein NDU88_006390 [Pleurodeles waltl]|uniref:Uncharacterized protein n=1 Tax=Pleurodeles waltl TaxID=8319 RepID=A0AAV7MZ26_PLEWA|nr:hypothetical protein NDU88_006390 [Pleurodeles waltl]
MDEVITLVSKLNLKIGSTNTGRPFAQQWRKESSSTLRTEWVLLPVSRGKAKLVEISFPEVPSKLGHPAAARSAPNGHNSSVEQKPAALRPIQPVHPKHLCSSPSSLGSEDDSMPLSRQCRVSTRGPRNGRCLGTRAPGTLLVLGAPHPLPPTRALFPPASSESLVDFPQLYLSNEVARLSEKQPQYSALRKFTGSEQTSWLCCFVSLMKIKKL